MGSPTVRPRISRRIFDPLFLCMVGAMILAVASSVALRAMVSGAGPAAAGAAIPDENIRIAAPVLHKPTDHE